MSYHCKYSYQIGPPLYKGPYGTLLLITVSIMYSWTSSWGALGHVTHVAKPVTINKRERDGILLRQMKISMVTIVKKTQPVLYPIYICMLLYDGRYMSRSGISVQWLNISY